MKRFPSAAWTLAMKVALPLVLLIACSPMPPRPGPDTPAPTRAAVASPMPTATPTPTPSIYCEQPQEIEGVPYASPTCDAALEVALAALPPAHPRIEYLDFVYGFFCGPNRYCSLALPPLAHVTVTYIDGSRVVVNVRGEPDGRVTVMGLVPLPLVEPSATAAA